MSGETPLPGSKLTTTIDAEVEKLLDTPISTITAEQLGLTSARQAQLTLRQLLAKPWLTQAQQIWILNHFLDYTNKEFPVSAPAKAVPSAIIDADAVPFVLTVTKKDGTVPSGTFAVDANKILGVYTEGDTPVEEFVYVFTNKAGYRWRMLNAVFFPSNFTGGVDMWFRLNYLGVFLQDDETEDAGNGIVTVTGLDISPESIYKAATTTATQFTLQQFREYWFQGDFTLNVECSNDLQTEDKTMGAIFLYEYEAI